MDFNYNGKSPPDTYIPYFCKNNTIPVSIFKYFIFLKIGLFTDTICQETIWLYFNI